MNWTSSAAKATSPDDIDTALVRMYRKTRAEGFGAEVKRRIMLGTYALSAGYYDAYYLKALKVRRLIRNDFDAAFQQVDLLIGPTTPSPAFRAGEKVDDPLVDVPGRPVYRHGQPGGNSRPVHAVRQSPDRDCRSAFNCWHLPFTNLVCCMPPITTNSIPIGTRGNPAAMS